MILNPLKSIITLEHFPSSQSQFYSLLFSYSLFPFFTLLPSSVCFYSYPICFIDTLGKRTGREANSHPQVIRYQWFVIAPGVSSRPLTAECKVALILQCEDGRPIVQLYFSHNAQGQKCSCSIKQAKQIMSRPVHNRADIERQTTNTTH